MIRGGIPAIQLVRRLLDARLAASKRFPPTSLVRRHERIASSRRVRRSVLARIADSAKHLDDIFKLDIATNERTLVEGGISSGIDPHELVFRMQYHHRQRGVAHPHPLGSRFNGPDRGPWYCGFKIETAIAEVAFHKTIDLLEFGVLEDAPPTTTTRRTSVPNF